MGWWTFFVVDFLFTYLFTIFSTSEVEPVRSFVRGVSELMGRVVPGAWCYEVQDRAFHIPYFSQLLTSIFVTIPGTFFGSKSMALYDVNRVAPLKKVDGVFNLKVNIVALLLVGLILLLLPPAGLVGGAYKTYFGNISPFRYALAALVIGYAVRVLVAQVECVTNRAKPHGDRWQA